MFGYGGRLSYHWRPQTLLCNFCDTDYNIIGHLEHMDEDIIESLKVLRMTETPVRENSSGNNITNKLPLKYWYNQLSPQLLADVQKLYFYDFKLLGYSTEIPN